MVWIAVAVGGALGSVARHAVNVAVARYAAHASLLSTGLVNVAGCFVIGLLAGAAATGRLPLSTTSRALLFVGLLGGFTTFSSLGLDTLTLVRSGRGGLALGNVAAQLLLGLPAVFAGYALGSR